MFDGRDAFMRALPDATDMAKRLADSTKDVLFFAGRAPAGISLSGDARAQLSRNLGLVLDTAMQTARDAIAMLNASSQP
jgi:hypothetical protein